MNLLRAFLMLSLVVPVVAHIGSPNVFFEGTAGPYPVRISIRPPDVVPGLAQINVRVHSGVVTNVAALPVRWDAGRKGAPPPDRARPVKGETNLFSTELWLMDFGAYSVFVDIEGQNGKGTAIVPVNSISTQRLAMPRWMGIAFGIAGGMLVLLLVCLIGAAVRESVLPAGVAADRRRVWRGWIAMAVASVCITLILREGKRWWDEVDAEFRNNRLFKPVEVATGITEKDGAPLLTMDLAGVEQSLRDRSPLVADHGKLMHLFLIKDLDLNGFVHLHPDAVSREQFETLLPRLPAGSYSVYADVVHESGLTQTLVSKVGLPGEGAAQKTDEDDSWWAAETVGHAGKPEVRCNPATNIRWIEPLPITQNQEVTLRFDVLSADGKAAPLEPYMGMWSHAVIRSRDGTVFTHLHPSGTISMTSQELFARRERGEDATGRPIDVVCGRPERELRFPYSFPKAGDFRVWVQVRSNGEILTAAYDVTVQAPQS